ncbi:hypothetical protein [Streptomyces sp. NL15-2K]|nr:MULTISPECIES: hypothetical protein [Actinomycetes]WKX07423.1 hypothetical protein Q4V64_07945 [Kutzneria buriramensis]GCB51343.1 hypothetical protein SNL152K_8699 [Streptomyces sp. NL15-2K]
MTITALAPAAHTAAGPFVLRTRQLRPGVHLNQTSRYDDEI